MKRRVVAVLALLTLCVTAAGFATVSGASGPSADPVDGTFAQTERGPLQTTPDGFTSTTFKIRAFENTSARWTVQHSRPLENESQRQQFESFASEFENQTTQTFADFQVRAQRLTRFGTNATDRRMNATGFSRGARVEDTFGQARGVVELSFVWTNLSAETDGGVVVGDVFEGGMFLGSDQRLTVSHGQNLRFTDVDPEPDSQAVEENLSASETVTWVGGEDGRQFANRRPRVVLSLPGETATVGTDAGTATPDSTATPAVSNAGLGPMAFVAALLLLVGVAGVIAWYSGALPAGTGRDSDSGGAGAPVADSTTATDSAAPAPETDQPIPEEEMLSDEDRVLTLLEDNGGRMKQVNIVEETEWSKSKVSMLLSDMEEEGDISKLRVGRENIISISGEEPDAVGSPFDDE